MPDDFKNNNQKMHRIQMIKKYIIQNLKEDFPYLWKLKLDDKVTIGRVLLLFFLVFDTGDCILTKCAHAQVHLVLIVLRIGMKEKCFLLLN